MADTSTITTLKKKLVYLYCVGNESLIRFSNVQVYSSLAKPCVSVFGVLSRPCHFSFVDNIGARYGAIIVDSKRAWKGKSLIHFQVPQLVSIGESCFSSWDTVADLEESRKRGKPKAMDEYGFEAHVITEWKTIANVPLPSFGLGVDQSAIDKLQLVTECDDCLGSNSVKKEDENSDSGSDRGNESNDNDHVHDDDENSDSDDYSDDHNDSDSDADWSEDYGNNHEDTDNDVDSGDNGNHTVSDSDDDGEGNDDGNANNGDKNAATADTQMYAEIMKISGCHATLAYQRTLEHIQVEMLLNKKVVPLKLEFDPYNGKDCNAIVPFAQINGKWEPLGCVPKYKIIKVTNAMRSGSIKKIKFERAPSGEAVKDGVLPKTLTCYIVIVKVGKWEKDPKRYSYNDKI